MSRLVRKLVKPLTLPVAICTSQVHQMDEPLKRHIDAYEQRGEDVCAAVWQEYITSQRALLQYRWKKLQQEVTYITSGQMSMVDLTAGDALQLLRFATKCLFLFLIAVMVGRRSIFPPLEPTSVFVEEVVKNWQPNHVNVFSSKEYINFLKIDTKQQQEENSAH